MSGPQDDIEAVKSWLLARVKKVIDVVILRRSAEGRPKKVIWEGQGKVLRCASSGVVLELGDGASHSWWGGILHFFKNLPVRYVVRPWEQRRLSIPYVDLSLDGKGPGQAVRLIIDAATWDRSPEELKQGHYTRTKKEKGVDE